MQFLFDMHNDTVKCQIKQYPKEHGIDQIWDFKSNDFCCWADLPDLQANCIKKKKITLTIQWNLKIKASSAAKPNQHELMLFKNSFAFSNMKDCVQSQWLI